MHHPAGPAQKDSSVTEYYFKFVKNIIMVYYGIDPIRDKGFFHFNTSRSNKVLSLLIVH